jgi:hypothetical protein
LRQGGISGVGVLPGAGGVPCRGEGRWFGDMAMNWVLILLQVAVLVTLIVAYGRD